MTNEILNGEMLNEEQLDAVVGGTRGELSCDTKFLYALGLMNNYHEPGYIENHVNEVIGDIQSAFKKVGIPYDLVINYSANGNNEYRLKMSAVSARTTRAKLYRTICEKVGKPDFDYKKYL